MCVCSPCVCLCVCVCQRGQSVAGYVMRWLSWCRGQSREEARRQHSVSPSLAITQRPFYLLASLCFQEPNNKWEEQRELRVHDCVVVTARVWRSWRQATIKCVNIAGDKKRTPKQRLTTRAKVNKRGLWVIKTGEYLMHIFCHYK